MLPNILVEIASLIIFIWAVYMLVLDLQISRKVWLNVLLHASVAIVSLNFFLGYTNINL